MTWAVYRDHLGVLRSELEQFVPADGTMIRSGLAGPSEAAWCKRDIEAAEEHARAVEAGQLDLFGGAE